MTVLEQIQSDVKDAMRARDTERATSLRMLVAALQNDAKKRLRELDASEEIAVLARERKQRVEAAEAFEQGGAADRAAAERSQIAMVEQYLPQQLSQSELEQLVDEAIAETGAADMKAMGGVMKVLNPKISGRADAGAVSALVRARLAAVGAAQ